MSGPIGIGGFLDLLGWPDGGTYWDGRLAEPIGMAGSVSFSKAKVLVLLAIHSVVFLSQYYIDIRIQLVSQAIYHQLI